MTGQGQARRQTDLISVMAEVRAVNNRFLKVTFSCSERYLELESRVRAVVPKSIRRGSVHVQLDIQRQQVLNQYGINGDVLRSYHTQLHDLGVDVPMSQCLELPGVVQELATEEDIDSIWPEIESALTTAIDKLIGMRKLEGESMAKDLIKNCDQIREHLASIRDRAPSVVDDYSRRLRERMVRMLAEYDITVTAADVVREVGIFAERCDISEEIVRMEAHLGQFSETVNASQSDGRKLEFLTQEMLRETNTIGSKANDSSIAQHVVEIKTAIERIREMTQNIE